MSGGPRSRSIAVFFCAAFALALVAPAFPAAAAGTSAFESIGGCFAAQKHVLLTFVIDESASLGDSSRQQAGNDPVARRVTAAQVAVDGIANLARQGTSVDVLLTGFSDDLHVYGGWQTLDPGTAAGVKQQLEGFRTRDQGLDTDFYNAMAGVQRELGTKSATLGEDTQPCELVLLFTDGKFDIDTHVAKAYDPNPDDPKAAKAAKGIAALCASNGPMQALRADGARTITLALADAATAPGNQPDRGFLQRLATGDCPAAGAEYGASFDVANAADLVGQFDGVATQLRGGTQLPGDCSRPQTVTIAPALRSLHIFADAGPSAGDVVLTPPTGKPIHISPGGAHAPVVPGLAIQATATGNRFLVVEVSPARGAALDANTWSGRWTVSFARPGGSARCRMFVFEAWTVKLRPVTLKRDVASTLVFDTVDANGRPVPASSISSTGRVTASVAEAGTSTQSTPFKVTRVGPHYEARVTISSGFTAQTAVVTATLHLSIAGADVASTPSAREVRIETPLGFPSIDPAVLHLSGVTGEGVARGRLVVIGDPDFAGKVCVSTIDYQSTPVAASLLSSTRAGQCVSVAAGRRSQLSFAVTTHAQADGRVNGRLHVVLTGSNGRTTQQVVRFTFSVSRVVNTTKRNQLFFLFFLAGVLAPLLLLYWMASRSAAFQLPAGVRAARIPVRLFRDGTMRRIDEDGMTPPFSLEEDDFVDAAIPAGRVKSLTWDNLEFEARWGMNPFAAPHGEVSVPRQFVTASEGVLRGRRHFTKGRVPLTLPGVWVFVLDPAADDETDDQLGVDGTVTVFIAAGAPFLAQAPRVMQSLLAFFAVLAARIDVPAETREFVRH